MRIVNPASLFIFSAAVTVAAMTVVVPTWAAAAPLKSTATVKQPTPVTSVLSVQTASFKLADKVPQPKASAETAKSALPSKSASPAKFAAPVNPSEAPAKTGTTTKSPPKVKPKKPARAAKPKARWPSTTLSATIDLARQRMTVKAGGTTLHSWEISSGTYGHETPAGRFRPKWIARKWHSRKYNMAPMPYSVFFNGGIATHGTNAVSRLGHPASHGCIRLRTLNARTFYQLVRKHGLKQTRITVTGRAKLPVRRHAKKLRPARSYQVSNRRRRRATPKTFRYTNSRVIYRLDRFGRINRQAYTPSRGSRFVYPGDRTFRRSY